MTDTIFRGKRLDNGEWITGSLVTLNGKINHMNTYIMDDCASVGMNDSGYTLGYFKEVDPRTVGQYTGLTDKNGQKIFEGDIVTGYFDGEKITGTIVYGSNAQYYIERNGLFGIYLDNSHDWLDVIGNRWDNPELLEGAK